MTLGSRAVTAALVSLATLAAFQNARAEQTKPAPAAAAGNIAVTVKYSGKGTVDATHRLWVWLFTTPDINPGAIPIAELSLDKNGAVASFPSVTAKEVYVVVAYDEKGGFQGQSAPPIGSPYAFYGAKTPQDKPAPVAVGAKTAITVALTEALRMQ